VEAGTGSGGTVFVQCCGALRDPKSPPEPAQIVMAVEQYKPHRSQSRKECFRLPSISTFKNKFYEDDLNSFNIIAEIPGSDKADEIVMLGAHF